jgi:tellurite resistance protein TerC
MFSVNAVIWLGFLTLIGIVIALDLGVFHRRARVISLAEALGWSAVWIALALVFNVGVYYLYELNPSGWHMDTDRLTGQQAAIQFFTGYLVEKSLSVDNIFVISMIFAYFQVPAREQHRVLFWGIIGAVVLRGIMIFGGIALIDRFEWLTYVFGAILIYSAAKLLVIKHDNVEVANSPLISLVHRLVPVTNEFHGSRFFVTLNGIRTATPLFMALVLVEFSDIIFAIDSIPAILAISRDPFIVFTSNIFALLGLRSLYFVLAGLMDKFRYLRTSLVFLLAYIGVKMLLVHHYPIPNVVSLAIICGILAVGILASTAAGRDTMLLLSPLADDLEKLVVASYRQARRAALLALTSSALLVGVIVALLPGQTSTTVPAALFFLSIQTVLTGRWLLQKRKALPYARPRTQT